MAISAVIGRRGKGILRTDSTADHEPLVRPRRGQENLHTARVHALTVATSDFEQLGAAICNPFKINPYPKHA